MDGQGGARAPIHECPHLFVVGDPLAAICRSLAELGLSRTTERCDLSGRDTHAPQSRVRFLRRVVKHDLIGPIEAGLTNLRLTLEQGATARHVQHCERAHPEAPDQSPAPIGQKSRGRNPGSDPHAIRERRREETGPLLHRSLAVLARRIRADPAPGVWGKRVELVHVLCDGLKREGRPFPKNERRKLGKRHRSRRSDRVKRWRNDRGSWRRQ